ncbi:unnamed protein product [Pleuronectes platessa]|uniref:Uncharacterized protein n=1 Tax=Pleuronectes platessa TaxID=8262 RepID=A0A9N7UN65_PLEPL|nr:unnamed protein product [Pleuronectes platessa]
MITEAHRLSGNWQRKESSHDQLARAEENLRLYRYRVLIREQARCPRGPRALFKTLSPLEAGRPSVTASTPPSRQNGLRSTAIVCGHNGGVCAASLVAVKRQSTATSPTRHSQQCFLLVSVAS